MFIAFVIDGHSDDMLLIMVGVRKSFNAGSIFGALMSNNPCRDVGRNELRWKSCATVM